jgi:hypothetical protein
MGAGEGWNSFFTHSLFTDDAIRAYLNLFKPGKGQRRVVDVKKIVTDESPTRGDLVLSSNEEEAARQAAKEDVQYDLDDPEAPENTVLVSLGCGIDGAVGRLHGGVSASLLDQCMGTLVIQYYSNTNATTELRIKYKKAVTTPCVLKVRAKIQREKGRWVELVSWVEDGEGTVYAEGWGSFVLDKVGSTAKM